MNSKTLFLTFLLTSQVAHANWSFTEKPYDLDETKEACVAQISTKHNDLEFNFPKDGKGFPVVKMTNKFDREYIAARMFISGSRVRFFGKDDRGQIEFYMVPRDAQELETVINIVKRNSRLEIDKVYKRGSRMDTGTGEFSLRGSSAALNRMQDCLGGQFLSSEQSVLLSDLNQRSFMQRNDDLGLDYQKHMQLGLETYRGIKSWNDLGDAALAAQAKVDEIKEGAEYRELKSHEREITAATRNQQARRAQINSNESFFANADKIVNDLREEKSNTQAAKAQLEATTEAQASELAALQGDLSALEVDLANAQARLDSADTSVANKRGDISSEEGAIADIQDVINSSLRIKAQLVALTPGLEQSAREARWRSDNSRQIKRDLEESLYRQYGGRPFELETAIDALNEDIKVFTAEAEVANRYQEEVEEVEDLAKVITTFNPDIERLENELNCFQTAQGAEQAKCLETSKNAIEGRIRAMVQERSGHQANRCRRLFNIGRKKCKRRRDAAIADLTRRIDAAEQEKQELLARINTIVTTGEDPQREETMRNLRQRLTNKRNQRKAAVDATQRRIDRIRNPRRPLPAVERVKNCQVRVARTCEGVAREAARRLETRASAANRESDRLVNEKTALQENLNSLRHALRTQVDGLESRLFEEYRTAQSDLDRNLDAIGRENAVLATKESELANAQIRVGGLRQQLGGLLETQRMAQSNVNQASAVVEDFKRANRIDERETEVSTNRARLTQMTQEIRSLTTRIANAIERKEQVAGERGDYPNELADIEQTLINLEAMFENIKPRLDEMNAEVANLEREARELDQNMRESRAQVRSNIELLRSKY